LLSDDIIPEPKLVRWKVNKVNFAEAVTEIFNLSTWSPSLTLLPVESVYTKYSKYFYLPSIKATKVEVAMSQALKLSSPALRDPDRKLMKPPGLLYKMRQSHGAVWSRKYNP
jgi:hypothetical protein